MTDETADRYGPEIDARRLRAIAHPLRMQILQVLLTDGPATSTTLAKRLGESTGTLSWHLRHLAAHGLIEEDPERGTRRERWWRGAGMNLPPARAVEFLADPGLRAPLSRYVYELIAWQFRLITGFYTQAGVQRFSDEWVEASTMTSWTGDSVRMSPAQLKALNDELKAVADRHVTAAEAAPEPDREQVVVLVNTFPYRPPDGTASGEVTGEVTGEVGDE